MKVRDFITMEIDIDVYDNVCDEIGIAFCGPLKLTEAGEAEFKDVLDYDIEVNVRDGYADIDVQFDDWEKRLKRAKLFFYGAAGYISEEDFNKWFIIE